MFPSCLRIKEIKHFVLIFLMLPWKKEKKAVWAITKDADWIAKVSGLLWRWKYHSQEKKEWRKFKCAMVKTVQDQVATIHGEGHCHSTGMAAWIFCKGNCSNGIFTKGRGKECADFLKCASPLRSLFSCWVTEREAIISEQTSQGCTEGLILRESNSCCGLKLFLYLCHIACESVQLLVSARKC